MMELYKQHREDIKTGDILLFSGEGLISSLIKLATKSQYSHVGVAFRTQEDILFCFHSTHLSFVSGVQSTFLSNLVRGYKGKIWWRPLENPLPEEKIHTMREFRRAYEGTPYEASKFELFLAAFGRKFNIKKLPSPSLFCSEMIAKLYQILNILPSSQAFKQANEYVPADFSSERPNALTLNDNTFLNEYLIKDKE